VSNPPILDLDLEKVGNCLVNALTTSVTLGHQHVSDTMRDYIRRDQISPEAKFVRDVLTRTSPDAATEWFGDPVEASAYTTYAVELVLDARPEDLQRTETTQ
jgi:hypothetical protein